MIGVDANVLVRLVVGDDVGQSARAEAFFRERSPDDPAAVSLVALVEFAWVLRRSYGRSPTDVARAIRGLLAADSIVIQSEQAVIRALRDAEESRADFADSVIAHLGLGAGCDYTVTFDRKAAELPGMLAL